MEASRIKIGYRYVCMDDLQKLGRWMLADTAKYPSLPFFSFFSSIFASFTSFASFSPTIMEHRCNSVLHVNKLNPCLRLGLALLAGRGGALVFDG